ncbi:hypothetical protein glysoja_027318 [Glycine soja]|uniref:Uncharacterized protein n=1 Tax=Glycine soja TaxID=3848 RepID=A0A0B2PV47_GLYSO|nr:hypothetical protein glysoja_027318 [Glycine soja]
MATGTVDNKAAKSKPPRPKRICFSFAAYAGDLLNCLKASKVAIDEGLSDAELSNIESKLKFSFPPDLRAILQQGLPVSQGFPNWRSSSTQQLQILLNLPASSILRRVSSMRFWHPSWGPEPSDPTRVIARLLHDAPPLVPIYRGCLERVVWKLREGGWTEEEIREMMTVEEKKKNKLKLKDKEALEWHVRALSLVLLRGGWSREDVVYSLGLVADQGKSWLEFHQDQHNLNINGF